MSSHSKGWLSYNFLAQPLKHPPAQLLSSDYFVWSEMTSARKSTHPVLDFLVNTLGVPVFKLLGVIPPQAALAIMASAFARFGPLVPKSKRIRTTLTVAFPHLKPDEIAAYEKNIWACFGRTIATIPHLQNFRDNRRGAKLSIRDNIGVQAMGGKPFILCGAHVGNWEVGAAATRELGGKVAITYKSLKFPAVDALVVRARSAMTNRLIAKENAIRGPMEVLTAGGAVYFTIDQRVKTGDEISFLGLPAQATRLPARLAVKFNCPVVPIEVVQVSGAHYEIVLDKALYPDPDIQDEMARTVSLMRRLFREIEDIVRRRPDEWFCWAPRWSAEELALIESDRAAAEARAKQLQI